MLFLSFDIGGTNTKYGILDENFNIIFKDLYPTHTELGGKHILESVIKKIATVKEKYNISGVAISSAGVIDSDNGLVKYANDIIPGYTGTNFKETINKHFGLNTSIENDVNCFALAETLNLNNEDFIAITVGTGIGGGIVINNRLFKGKDLTAGEFGQMIIDGSKWEKLCSLSSTVNYANNIGLNIKNTKHLFDLYDSKDMNAHLVVTRFYKYLAMGLCNLAYCFNPSYIVIGGGISNRGQKFIDEIMAVIDKSCDKSYFGSTKVIPCHYQNDGGIIGALVNYFNQYHK